VRLEDKPRVRVLPASGGSQSVGGAIEPAWFQSDLFRSGRLVGAFEQLDRMTGMMVEIACL